MRISFSLPIAFLFLTLTPLAASAADMTPKAATPQTAAANSAVARALNLAGRADAADASRGLIAVMPEAVIKNANGDTIWDEGRFDFIKGNAPDSVNPSLWRHEQLNNAHGLFKIADGIYQVRGYDIANMTLVSGNTGWIVIDTLLTAEMSKAAMAFVDAQLGKRPVQAVIYTHSHADHFGGVRGVVSEADVKAGKVRIIAPDGFMEYAIAENVLAGNAMTRRAQYQFGTALPWNERGAVGTGLGKALSVGTIGLIAPTDVIAKTGQEMTVDGVRMVFQMANGSEAPAEYMLYFPDLKALCLSEVVTANMHNVYTLRGAKTRDALAWSKYINEALDLFADAEVAFRSHQWPVWGRDNIRRHLANHRDTYRFINDEALRLANSGRTMDQIGNALFFPRGLTEDLSTHGYYGTLSHNLRGVYNYYLGFYDGNPASLNRLPPQESAKRYVDAMGGGEAMLTRAKQAFAAGDYRWVAEMVNYLVFAEPQNEAARALQADALEQLGYQAESGVWRNEYLTAAQELRKGVQKARASTNGADTVRAMPLAMIFDFMAVRLDHAKVDGLRYGTNVVFSDTNESFALELSNSVLNNTPGRVLKNPDATLTLTHAALYKMLLNKTPLRELVMSGEAKFEGEPRALGAVFTNLETFDPLFNIVTP
jgi:linear primary-alkylsulfatase